MTLIGAEHSKVKFDRACMAEESQRVEIDRFENYALIVAVEALN